MCGMKHLKDFLFLIEGRVEDRYGCFMCLFKRMSDLEREHALKFVFLRVDDTKHV